MKAEVVNVKRLTFIGKAESNHWMVMDGSKEFGGFEAGIKPMEAVLVALGGCYGHGCGIDPQQDEGKLRLF